MSLRTYIYKLTSDRGGAPCAPEPRSAKRGLLTLSICKPAIRRTAQPGDRILGITSHALANREGYPLQAVIYAAIVACVLDPQQYYKPHGKFVSRPDCIYAWDRATGLLEHTGKTRLHCEPAYAASDVGRFPYYQNAHTLLCEDFRYFGLQAVPIPERFPGLMDLADRLGQGHRVIESTSSQAAQLDALFKALWKRPTRYTPEKVEEESYGHRLPRAHCEQDDT